MNQLLALVLAFVSVTGLAQWTCGDTWTYQGYDYETVQIGGQCWFAENLRSEQYANGDVIPSNVPDSALWTTQGAQTFLYLDSTLLEERGRLYNALAVTDQRGLCPTDWHVPTDDEFMDLELYIGMSEGEVVLEGERGCEEGIASLVKSESGWSGEGAGTNETGLGLTRTGYQFYPDGTDGFGNYSEAAYWSSSIAFEGTLDYTAGYWYRNLSSGHNCIYRAWNHIEVGKGVRCMRAVGSGSTGDSDGSDNDIQGCTDPDALNFNPEATADDESCTYAPEVPECASVCGPGTYWDMEQSLCLPTLSADLDLSGCVGMSDLLEMLAQFGTCYVPEWSCGDDWNYQGYDYQTVMVAGDCWFAENLKSENYRNGDPIPALEGEEAWFYTEEGAQGVYANGQVPCSHFCNPAVAEDLFGRVYNWFAVDDNRGLCPSGWHVSEEGEWDNLFSYVEGQVGDSVSFALKATSTWYEIDGIPGVGTDDFGMSIMPTGQRAVKLHGNGNLALDANAGYQGSYWTSDSHSAEFGRDVYFHHWYLDPNISYLEKEYAVSVRCVLD